MLGMFVRFRLIVGHTVTVLTADDAGNIVTALALLRNMMLSFKKRCEHRTQAIETHLLHNLATPHSGNHT